MINNIGGPGTRTPIDFQVTSIPGLCPDAAGFHRSTTGDNRGYAGMLPASTGAAPGNSVTALKMSTLRIIPVLAGRPALANRDGPGLYRQK
ncbi:hypothetical protein DPMN_125903 [Dreissena polymorpha]|uniref:Uncharacterized protein n=1 Tax=Dreissena polymorpha TaxID=45954 RepID=A0A9D4JTH0_DREPO|nr:hypothetical protein DPMN_125903 [Dreissena polymorpha]